MNPGDGVVQNSDGSWTATVNGNVVYNGPDNQQAQNAFISGQGNGNNQTIIGGQGYDPSTPTPGSEGFDQGYYSAAETAIQNSINNAYREQYLNAIDIPGLNLKANDLALQAAQQRAQDLMQYTSANGDLALKSFSEVGSLGIDIANLLTKMQGPSNAFAYDRAMSYLGSSGLGASVGAVTGAGRPAQFGLMGPTSPWDFSSMNAQLGNTGTGPNVIDQLLGLGMQAQQQYTNGTNGQLPFSIPQFDVSQNQLQAPSTPPQNQQQQVQQQQVQQQLQPQVQQQQQVLQDQTQQQQQTQQNVLQNQQNTPTALPGTPQNAPSVSLGDPTQQNQQNTPTALPGTPQNAPSVSLGNPSQQNQQGTNGIVGTGFSLPSSSSSSDVPVKDTGPSTPLNNGPSYAAPSSNPSTPPVNPYNWTQVGLGAMGINSDTNPGQWSGASYPGYSAAASQYLYGLPDPSQMNATNFFQLPKYSQQLMLSGYAAKGYDPNQLTDMWAAQLPGKAAGPAFGLSS